MTSAYRRLLRERAATDDAAFAEYMSGLVFPEHLREASRFANNHQRGLVLAPRGHAKTTLALFRAARLIGVSGGRCRLGILTAVDADADARSRAIRAIVESPRFAEVFPWAARGVEGRPWTDAAWTVRGVDLGKDFTCTAMSLGSVRAGPRLDYLLADDPVGQQENATAAGRAKALETYLGVVDPMVVPEGIRMFLGTRWHEDDIYAYLIRIGWPYLLRRAIEDGKPLWADRFSLAELAERRTLMGKPLFDLQFQNDPEGMGGNIFRREWFRYVDVIPGGTRRVGMDLNASSSERADYTAVIEWIEDDRHNLYLVGAWRKQLGEGHRRWLTGRTDSLEYGASPAYGELDGPQLLVPIGRLPPRFVGGGGHPTQPRHLTKLCIETVTFENTFVREILDRTNLPAVAVHPDRDKVTRARTLAARYEAGKVYHLSSAPGLADYEDELVTFPNGRHDDQVDAAVYGADLGAAQVFATPMPRVSLVGLTRGIAGSHHRHGSNRGGPWEPSAPSAWEWWPNPGGLWRRGG
ncbi:MAG: phage terminase large subunit [Candidatus Limnocylindrales bacterium]